MFAGLEGVGLDLVDLDLDDFLFFKIEDLVFLEKIPKTSPG
jgi:hypothetical protein